MAVLDRGVRPYLFDFCLVFERLLELLKQFWNRLVILMHGAIALNDT